MKFKNLIKIGITMAFTAALAMTSFAEGGYNGSAAELANEFTVEDPTKDAYLKTGHTVNSILTSLVPSSNIKAITWSDKSPASLGVTEKKNLSESGAVWAFVDPSDSSRILIYSKANTIHMNEDSAHFAINLSSLTDISSFSHFDAGSVTNFTSAFNGCTKLSDVSAIANWNTGKATDFNNMFNDCTSLTNASGLGSWNTSKVTNLDNAFLNTGAHNTYDNNSAHSTSGFPSWYLNTYKFDSTTVQVPKDSTKVYANLLPTTAADGHTITGWNTKSDGTGTDLVRNSDGTYTVAAGGATYYSKHKIGTATLVNGTTFNAALKTLANGGATTAYTVMDSKIKKIVRTTTMWDSNQYTTKNISASSEPVYARFDSSTGTIYWYTETSDIKLPSDFSSAFYGMSALTEISSISAWNASNVTRFTYMFRDCASLADLSGLSSWNMGSATTIGDMFRGCTSLTNLSALKSWNVSNVTYFGQVFNGCTKLSDVSAIANWNTGKATDFNNMFNGCTSLTNASGLGSWNTSKVTNLNNAFLNTGVHNTYDNNSAHSASVFPSWYLNTYKFDSTTVKVPKDSTKVYANLLPTTTADGYAITGWNTKSDGTGTDLVRSSDGTYTVAAGGATYYSKHYQATATLVDGQTFNKALKSLSGSTASIKYTQNVIKYFVRTTTAWDFSTKTQTLSTSDSEKPVYARFDSSTGTIYWYSEATDIKLPSDFSYAFHGLRALKNLDSIADWDSSNVTNFSYTFFDNYVIESLSHLANWNVSNCTNFAHMFSGGIGQSFDLSALANWDVSSGRDFSYMFWWCSGMGGSGLQDLSALANWNVSNGRNFSQMFAYTFNLKNLHGLENWNVSNGTNFKMMFYQNNKPYEGYTASVMEDLSAIEGWTVKSSAIKEYMFDYIPSSVARPSWYYGSNSLSLDANGGMISDDSEKVTIVKEAAD